MNENTYDISAKHSLDALVEAALKKTDDQLYEDIGEWADEIIDFDLPDPKELRKSGEIWLRQKESELKVKLCNEKMKDIIVGDFKDIANAIAIAVVGVAFGAQAAAIGVLIARKGIEIWCDWDMK